MVSRQVLPGRAIGWLVQRALGGWHIAALGSGCGLAWGLRGSTDALGLASISSGEGGFLYELAFMASLAGVALGLAALGRHGWVLGPLDRVARAGAELGVLVAGGAGAVLLSWTPVLMRPESLPWAQAAMSLVHLALLGQLASRLPTPKGLHSLVLVALAWWIPAVLGASRGGALRLAALLATPDVGPMQLPGAVDMAPAVAFGLAAWLLTPKIPRP